MAGFLATGRTRGRCWRGRRGSSMVRSRQLCRPCRPTRLFMAAVAFLHYSVGTSNGGPTDWPRSDPSAGCALVRSPGRRPPREHATTCSTSTPSSSWRSRCSFSCGCAACSASAPAASGRPTIPIRRAPRHHPAGPSDKVVALPGRARRYRRRSPPSRPSRSSAGRASPSRARPLAAGLDAIAREDPTFDAKHFLTGARAAYEMIVTAYAAGDRRQLEESARQGGL